jgi:hypothetical protein
MVEIKKCRDFTRDYDYPIFTVVRVFNGFLEELGGRRSWVVVVGETGKIYRRVMGAGGTGIRKGDIELDYDSRKELGVAGRRDKNGFYTCDLVIRKAKFTEKVRAHWKHPSLEYRVPFQLALLSLALGLIGLGLGIISLV